ncbi:MAG: DUF1275 family protein [Rhizomicrobium sp.]
MTDRQPLRFGAVSLWKRKGDVLRLAALVDERLALVLAMAAGIVDAYGLARFGAYLPVMGGNTLQSGYRVAHGDFAAAALSAILLLVDGSFAGPAAAFGSRALVVLLLAALVVSVIGLVELGRPAWRRRYSSYAALSAILPPKTR